MELNEYQKQAMTTCMESSNNFSYMFLNLVGEVGEFASKVAKAIRKEKASLGLNPPIQDVNTREDKYYDIANHLWTLNPLPSDDFRTELMKEAGDILWQLSGLCSVMNWSLEDIARMNLDKLAARKAIGTIDGNGDGIERDK